MKASPPRPLLSLGRDGYCDELASIPKSALTDYVGSLSAAKQEDLRLALMIALALD